MTFGVMRTKPLGRPASMPRTRSIRPRASALARARRNVLADIVVSRTSRATLTALISSVSPVECSTTRSSATTTEGSTIPSSFMACFSRTLASAPISALLATLFVAIAPLLSLSVTPDYPYWVAESRPKSAPLVWSCHQTAPALLLAARDQAEDPSQPPSSHQQPHQAPTPTAPGPTASTRHTTDRPPPNGPAQPRSPQ